jgi:TP901 family phage tail tape measure protein
MPVEQDLYELIINTRNTGSIKEVEALLKGLSTQAIRTNKTLKSMSFALVDNQVQMQSLTKSGQKVDRVLEQTEDGFRDEVVAIRAATTAVELHNKGLAEFHALAARAAVSQQKFAAGFVGTSFRGLGRSQEQQIRKTKEATNRMQQAFGDVAIRQGKVGADSIALAFRNIATASEKSAAVVAKSTNRMQQSLGVALTKQGEAAGKSIGTAFRNVAISSERAQKRIAVATNRMQQSLGVALTKQGQAAGESIGTAFRNVGKSIENADKQVKQTTKSFNLLGRTGSIVFGILVFDAIQRMRQAISEAVRDATALQIAVAEIQTISPTQQSVAGFKFLQKSIREISDVYNLPQADVAEANYQTLSNQVAEGAESFEFVESAAGLAKIAVSSVSDAVQLLSSDIKAYNLDQSNAEQLAAQWFKTVERGRVRVAELQPVSRINILGAQLGIEESEIKAAIATISRQGIKADETFTLLRNVILKLIKPTKAMKELFEEWGVASGSAAIQTFGFFEAVSRIRARVGIAAVGGTREIIRGLESDQTQILNSTSDAGKAMALVMENAGQSVSREMQQVKNQFIAVGDEIVVFLSRVNKLVDLSDSVARLGRALKDVVIPPPLRGLSFLLPRDEIQDATDAAFEYAKILKDIKKELDRIERTRLTEFTSFLKDISKITLQNLAEQLIAANKALQVTQADITLSTEESVEAIEDQIAANEEALKTDKERLETLKKETREHEKVIKLIEREIETSTAERRKVRESSFVKGFEFSVRFLEDEDPRKALETFAFANELANEARRVGFFDPDETRKLFELSSKFLDDASQLNDTSNAGLNIWQAQLDLFALRESVENQFLNQKEQELEAEKAITAEKQAQTDALIDSINALKEAITQEKDQISVIKEAKSNFEAIQELGEGITEEKRAELIGEEVKKLQEAGIEGKKLADLFTTRIDQEKKVLELKERQHDIDKARVRLEAQAKAATAARLFEIDAATNLATSLAGIRGVAGLLTPDFARQFNTIIDTIGKGEADLNTLRELDKVLSRIFGHRESPQIRGLIREAGDLSLELQTAIRNSDEADETLNKLQKVMEDTAKEIGVPLNQIPKTLGDMSIGIEESANVIKPHIDLLYEWADAFNAVSAAQSGVQQGAPAQTGVAPGAGAAGGQVTNNTTYATSHPVINVSGASGLDIRELIAAGRMAYNRGLLEPVQ